MAKAKTGVSSDKPKKMRPALTPEAREQQLIAMAYDAAEEQFLAGTASSQVITHFLKLGTVKERLEKEKLEEENKLLRAKTKAIESSEEIKALYADAVKAMRRYSGAEEDGDDDDYY